LDKKLPWLVVALELALAAFALRAIVTAASTVPIAAPFEQNYAEGAILNALVGIAHGETPYPDPHRFPAVFNQYGPAAYYLLSVPVRIFGPGFLYPRMAVLGCTLLIATLIAFELRRKTRDVILAVAFGLYYLALPNVQNWGWLLRVDSIGIALTLGGLILFSRRFDREEPPGVWPAVLFAAAALVKPTLIAAPAACFFALIARRRFRDAVNLAGVTAAAFGTVMAFFIASTRGAVFVHLFLTHSDPYRFGRYLGLLEKAARQAWPLLLLAAVALADDAARRRASPPVLWFLIATATSATAGALGKTLNHFLEWDTAVCLAAGLGMSRLTRIPIRKVAFAATALAVVALAFKIRQPRDLEVGGQAGCAQAYEFVRSAGSNVLAENVGSLVLGEKRVWVSDPFVLAQLVERAGWSDAELVRMVREQRFDAVIVDDEDDPAHPPPDGGRFSPAVLQALGENYARKPFFQCQDMDILFTPKTRPPGGATATIRH